MIITVNDAKREIGRKVPCFRGKECAADMIERAEKTLRLINDKETLAWHLKNPSGWVRSQVIRNLGELCCEEGKKANVYDYEIFAKAIFEDDSFMVGEEAVKALAKIKTPAAVGLLVQALGCDIGQVRAAAEKALGMLIQEERQMLPAEGRKRNWIEETVAATLETMDE